MLSAKIHTAALAHARQLTNDHRAESLVPFVDAFETGYHKGFQDRPKAACFPLSGQREFLRVLAPYLAENIEIYHPATGRYGRLKGLPATYEGQGEPLADVEFYADADAQEEGGGDVYEPASKILPVLYGFEDLATELTLADGRRVVPAVEVARTALRFDEQTPLSKARFLGCDIVVTAKADEAVYQICFAPSGDISIERRGPRGRIENAFHNQLAVRRLLLSYHFAVGLRPEQYKRKAVAAEAKEFDACSDDCHKCGATDWSRKGPDNCNKCEAAPATAPHNCKLSGCAILVDELGPCVGCSGKEVCPNA